MCIYLFYYCDASLRKRHVGAEPFVITYEKMESEYLACSFSKGGGIRRVWPKFVMHSSCQSAGRLCLNHQERCHTCSWKLCGISPGEKPYRSVMFSKCCKRQGLWIDGLPLPKALCKYRNPFPSHIRKNLKICSHRFFRNVRRNEGFLGGSEGKESVHKAGDPG